MTIDVASQADRIRRRRLQINLNQRQAADRSGLSQATWSRIENGTKTATLGELIGVSRTTLGYLTGGSALMGRGAGRADGVDTAEVEDRLRHLMEMDALLDRIESRRECSHRTPQAASADGANVAGPSQHLRV
jgi:transcriptional regulator with XRE-family HTH domain